MTKLPQDNRLHELLERRAAPAIKDDFAARIISNSCNVTQRKNITLTVWLRRIFTEFSLPTPVYALASILLVGFVIGLGLQDFDLSESNNITNAPDTIFSEESIL